MIRHLTYIVIAKKNILTVFLFRFSRAWGGAHPLRITFFLSVLQPATTDAV